MHATPLIGNVPFSRIVERVRSVRREGDRARRVDRLPDGRTMMVLRVLEGGGGDLTIAGPRTRALLKDAVGFRHAVGFEFRAGWSTPLLGVPASDLTDRYVTLEDVWGAAGRDLSNALVHAKTEAEVIDRVTNAFTRRLPSIWEPTTSSLARRAVRLIEGGAARVDRVASRLGVTARHLRRAFADNIGVGPKAYARAVRLQRAVRMATPSTDWARVAVEAGYFDQAHLITEFRDLVGLTPSAYLKRREAVR